jgi:protein-L-isoaspartate O-methyltransferase
LAEIIGERGLVAHVQVYRELSRRVVERLTALGYRNIGCVTVDSFFGYPAQAPYDRMLLMAYPLSMNRKPLSHKRWSTVVFSKTTPERPTG